MNGNHRSLHVDQIVLAQSAHPFARLRRNSVDGCVSRQRLPAHGADSNECAIPAEYVQRYGVLEFAGIHHFKI